VEDSLGSSRIVTSNAGVVCYDADFYPFGGERAVTDTCTQNNYKFEGKERDAETSTLPGNANGNDYFGARYYSNRFGRWLSADWSNVPAAVPYANLTNPQTLNLYSMVSDDPESFADLDGHDGITLTSDDVLHVGQGVGTLTAGGAIAAPTVVAIATGGIILGAELESFNLAINYPHVPCSCVVDAMDPPRIEAPPIQKSDRPDTLGQPDHQQTASEEQLKRPGSNREDAIPTPGGEKGHRKGDVVVRDSNGNPTEVVQVIRPNKSGTLPAREVRAANDIAKAVPGVKITFVPVRPIVPKPNLPDLTPPQI
jgi:RHS repeat-associated protein